MKACIIQPPYSVDTKFSDEYFEFKLACLDRCDSSADIIVLPEYSDVPCAAGDLEGTIYWHKRYFDRLISKCVETARRCRAMVFVNALSAEPTGYRNTTFAFDREGNLAGKYFKRHLPPFEAEVLKLDGDYTREFAPPYILELEGLRFAFLTCYDFYFYEAFTQIAREKPDIIIGCSLQRSDSHDAIETMCKFLAYNTNAYVLRSSVSFAEDSEICGASMAVSPWGRVLVNMKGSFGMTEVEFDPKEKHYKPAGYGNPPAAHHEYIEYGRNPVQYRNAGAGMSQTEADMPYPRVCAHRGFSSIAPENSMPAYGAAVAMGAEEIEMDIWSTTDGVIVSSHDDILDRVSNGSGLIYEKTYAELMELDFGIKHGESFVGLRIPTFEEILQKFAGRVIMNVHVKIWDCDMPDDKMEDIVALIRKYGAEKYVYFMSSNDKKLKKAMEYAPDIGVCVGWDGNEDKMSMPNRALAIGARKIQLFKPHFNAETVKYAHENGIICNVFWSDDPAEAKEFLEMGIETILSNDYQSIAVAKSEFVREK